MQHLTTSYNWLSISLFFVFRINPFTREPLTVDTLLEFTFFEDGVCRLSNGVTITDKGDEYVVAENDAEVATVPCQVILPPPADKNDDGANESNIKHFIPPEFGVTMLGNSDGFDANGTTTGFVVWMNRRGIMVDPPVSLFFILCFILTVFCAFLLNFLIFGSVFVLYSF